MSTRPRFEAGLMGLITSSKEGSMSIALYARVSTKNNGQDPETQLLALREYAKARNGVSPAAAKNNRNARPIFFR